MSVTGIKTSKLISTIKSSISDADLMQDLTPTTIRETSAVAAGLFSESDVRNFIYRCLINHETDKALAMVDGAIAYIEQNENDADGLRLVGAAVSTLSVLQESIPELKPRLIEILNHPNPDVVACAIRNLVHSSNLESLYKVYDFLEHRQFKISAAAATYVENCTRDAAFRKRRGTFAIDDEAEEFLRNALVPLEGCYSRLKENQGGYILKRLSILVAVVYNEILDSMDWKESQGDRIDKASYASMEQDFFDSLAPEALDNLMKAAMRRDREEGTKKSVLNTIGRISNQNRFKKRILEWLEEFRGIGPSPKLLKIASAIEKSCQEKEKFVAIPWPEELLDRSSIVPRTVT